MPQLSSISPYVLSMVRVVSALIFMLHGSQKLLDYPARKGGAGVPEMFSLPWIAGSLELVGGALLLIGLFTRPVAFILSGLMAAAYWIAHAPRDVFPTLNGGDAAILYCFIFFYFVFAGGGPLSVDRLIRGRG